MKQKAGAATLKANSNAKGKIVIVGGGLAGVSTAAKINECIGNADITIIEPNTKSVIISTMDNYFSCKWSL